MDEESPRVKAAGIPGAAAASGPAQDAPPVQSDSWPSGSSRSLSPYARLLFAWSLLCVLVRVHV